MHQTVLLAAAGRRRLQEALGIAAGQPLVVFATMDGAALGRLEEAIPGGGPEIMVYFYETG